MRLERGLHAPSARRAKLAHTLLSKRSFVAPLWRPVCKTRAQSSHHKLTETTAARETEYKQPKGLSSSLLSLSHSNLYSVSPLSVFLIFFPLCLSLSFFIPLCVFCRVSLSLFPVLQSVFFTLLLFISPASIFIIILYTLLSVSFILSGWLPVSLSLAQGFKKEKVTDQGSGPAGHAE